MSIRSLVASVAVIALTVAIVTLSMATTCLLRRIPPGAGTAPDDELWF
jgi:hypothetical protein